MKTLLRIASVTMAISVAVSCIYHFDDQDISAPGSVSVTFIAEVPGTDTRAYLDGTRSYWENGDKITIHNGSKGFDFVTSIPSEGNVSEAEFTYSGSDYASAESVIAVYPAGVVREADIEAKAVKAYIPADQKATPGSYDRNAALAVALTDNERLVFQNAVALVRFTVSTDNVEGVIFKGNDNEAVAGDVLVSMTEDNTIADVIPQKAMVNGASAAYCTEVGLYAEEGETLKVEETYYIAVAPGKFTQGFSIELVIDGERRKVKNLDVEYTVKPNKILNFGEFEYWSWDDTLADSADDVPTEEEGGWIMITRAEELAALMIYGGKENAKYCIANDLVMKGMPKEVAAKITDGVLFKDITVDGAGYMISDMDLPAARGIFSKVENFTAMNIDIENVSVGSEEAVGNIAGTGVFIGQASGSLSLEGIDISDSEAVAPCKVGSLVGAMYEGTASVSGCSVTGGAATTVWVENVSGQCGGLVGYVGRTDEGASADRSKTVSLTVSDSNVTGTQVNTQVSSLNRPSGIFIGALNGYDWQEGLSVDNCSSTAVLTVDSDKGIGAEFASRYNNACKAEFVDAIVNENLLGGQAYCRATVNFDGKPFVPAWDGQRTIKPLAAVEEYDGWSSGTVIYSAEDLASLQGKSATSGNHYLLADVDMGGDYGAVFNSIKALYHLDGVKKSRIGSEGLTKADNNTIYNCKVVLESHDGTGAAFIQAVSKAGTQHLNVNMHGADISNHHDESLIEPGPYDADNGAGNAYGGTFVSKTSASYTISNVHVSAGKVHGLCKIGGLIGYVGSTLNMAGCSVSDYVVENYEANIKNYYSMQTTVSSFVVYANEWWYTQGECGGLIGFVKSTDALIDRCSVTDTKVNCYGQPNKTVEAGVYSSGFTPQNPTSRIARGQTTVAGRHINQFIGDVRSSKPTDKVVIKDYYVSGNTYFDTPAETASTSNALDIAYRHCYKNSGTSYNPKYHYCNCVGSAYYVGVDVKVNLILTQLEKHVAEYAGSLTFNALGEEPVTLTEVEGDGNDMAWTGGDFVIAGLGY